MIKRQHCLEMPPKLKVTAWRDPVIEAAGHRPGSPYVEGVWVPVIGPSSALGWQRLACIAASGQPEVTIDAAELAASLGLARSLGRNAPISRTIARLQAFGTLHRSADTLGVRLALPDLPEHRVAKLCATAQLAHQRFAHRHRAPNLTASQPSVGVEL